MTDFANRVFMMGQTAVVAPGRAESVGFAIPAELTGLVTPRWLHVGEARGGAPLRMGGELAGGYAVEFAGRRVTHGLPRLIHEPDDATREPDLWPSLKAGDRVAITVDNPTVDELKVSLALALAPEPPARLRVETTLPPLADGVGATAVRVAPGSARLVRLEFETTDEWAPPGWNVEQITIGKTAQMAGGCALDAQALTACFAYQGIGGPRFSTVLAEAAVSVAVRREIGAAAQALTVRAVLEPMPTTRRAAGFRGRAPWEEG